MPDFDNDIRSQRAVILFFAFVSTLSSAAAAILPFAVAA
jgi:hypothetical protein